MRYRLHFGLLAPCLAQAWTAFTDTKHRYDQCGKWDNDWDGRNPKGLVARPNHTKYWDHEDMSNNIESKRPKANRNIILIRHGQYQDQEDTDDKRHLTDKGRDEVRATGRRLKELHESGMLPITNIISSTMIRAIETADLISKEIADTPIPRHMDPLLCEGLPCPPEPEVSFFFTKSECLTEGACIEAAFRRYFHRADPGQEKDSYEIITCHGNVIRYFVCRALQFPPEAWLRMSVAHASITWILIRHDGSVILRCLGDIGHLPPELVTTRGVLVGT